MLPAELRQHPEEPGATERCYMRSKTMTLMLFKAYAAGSGKRKLEIAPGWVRRLSQEARRRVRGRWGVRVGRLTGGRRGWAGGTRGVWAFPGRR